MPITVRPPTDDEKAELVSILSPLSVHVEACDRCASSLEGAGMCDYGRELYERWLAMLGGL